VRGRSPFERSARDRVAVHVGEPEVAQDEVRLQLQRERDPGLAVVRDVRVVALHREELRERLGRVDVVLDDEHHARRREGGARRPARRRGSRERQVDDEVRPGPCTAAVSGHRASVEDDQTLHERQPEAEPSQVSRGPLRPLDERLEHPIENCGLDPRSVVTDVQRRASVAGLDRDADVSGRRGELRRVLEEVAENLRHPGPVPVDPDRAGRDVEAQGEPALLEHGPVVVARAPHDLPQIEPLAVQLDLPLRDACGVEQVVHEPGEVRELAADDLPRPLGVLAARSGAVEDVQGVLDRRERVAELVRENSEELGLALVRLAREQRLPVRRLGEPPLALGDEVLDRVRDRVVESDVEAGQLGHPRRHAERALATLLLPFRCKQQVQERDAEHPHLVDELTEREGLVDAHRRVRDGGCPHPLTACRFNPLDPVGELVEQLREAVAQDGARELHLPRLARDERLPLAEDLFAVLADEAGRRQRHGLSVERITRPARELALVSTARPPGRPRAGPTPAWCRLLRVT
jgi:hypothetical protein